MMVFGTDDLESNDRCPNQPPPLRKRDTSLERLDMRADGSVHNSRRRSSMMMVPGSWDGDEGSYEKEGPTILQALLVLGNFQGVVMLDMGLVKVWHRRTGYNTPCLPPMNALTVTFARPIACPESLT